MITILVEVYEDADLETPLKDDESVVRVMRL